MVARTAPPERRSRHGGSRPVDPRLHPRDGELHVVRWIRADGRSAKHRYYRRASDAEAFYDRLVAGGWEATIYAARVTWDRWA